MDSSAPPDFIPSLTSSTYSNPYSRAFVMENMQSFKTNDNVTLKYFDSGAAEEGENEKPWLILVR
jgi:hypothetical protein